MSEQDVKTENETVEETTTEAESSPAEQQTDQQPEQVESTGEVEQPEEPKPEVDRPRKKNAQGRIKELLEEKKGTEDRLRELLASREQSPRDGGSFSDRFKGANEVNPEDLDRAAEEYAAQRAQDMTRSEIDALKSEWRQEQLRSDVERIQNTRSELNPNSDSYDAELDERIAAAYQKYGNGARLVDFVEDYMSVADAKATRAAAETSAAVERQKEETAITPGSKPKQTKSVQEKSIAELEAELGFAE